MKRTRATQTGITMIEMLAASVVAGALIAFVAQMLVAAATQQQAANGRMLASAELANLAERVATMEYGDVTIERLEKIELSPAVAESFGNATLTFKLQREAGPPAGKRIDIALSWNSRAGGAVRALRLTSWRFATGEKTR